jgi:acyl-CoA synthetase (AMP-forming)/AMP-acid ligase II
MKAGGVFMVVNSTTKDEKLEFILRDSGARGILSWDARIEILTQLVSALPELDFGVVTGVDDTGELPSGLLRYHDLIVQNASKKPDVQQIDRDLACLIYTSGSTGEPKGVMSDHSNVTFAVRSITTYLRNVEDDVVINFLPLSFDYGLYQLLMVFSFGGRLILERGFTYPALVLKRIEEESVTGFPGVPTVYSMLLAQDLEPYNLSSLTYMTNTAAALPPSHITRIRERFPDVRLYSMYGLTETKRTLYLPIDQLNKRPGSVGIAIPGTEVWIEAEDGSRLGAGEVGELVVRGRHVMRGYWGDPQATRERFRPGTIPGEQLCYTGDLFRMDEEGFLYFVSRKDDIIKSRGEKVAPKEVEEVIYRLAGVQEVAVFGVPDAVMGEIVKAMVVVENQEITPAHILRHCRQNLEDFMVPRYVEICSVLPKTSSGKIKKTGLN